MEEVIRHFEVASFVEFMDSSYLDAPLLLYFLSLHQKLDLGVCSKLHDPALKADYELAAKEKDFDYEIEVFN